jgi:serine/threonine-protein kinase
MWTVPGYTDGRELGHGASGRVVLATHDGLGTPVAVKYLKGDEALLRDFRAEARLLAEVVSPNVARLYEYVEADAGAAIVMELVDGLSLRTMIREQGPMAPEAALCVLKGSLLGLAAAHAHGVVHRDYKPGNVLVDVAGDSKLADFGVATRAGREVAAAGTPIYMAPEQWAGNPATPASDIYAATATFFECLTGRPPYPNQGDLAALRRQHENAPIPTDEVPDPVRGLVRGGLAKDPVRRPAGALRFVAELESAARQGYGEDWERRGRGALVQRVALLALLLPWAAGVVGGSALAVTALGTGALGDGDPGGGTPAGSGPGDPGSGDDGAHGDDRAAGGDDASAGPGGFPRAWIMTATAGVALAATMAVCVLPRFIGRPEASSAPMAVTEVTPSATPSAGPTPSVAPVTAGPTSAPPAPPAPPPPPPPRTTTSKPPPPPLAVTSISVTSFAYTGNGNEVRATVLVKTTTKGAFTLSVRFAGIDDQGAESAGPVTRTYQRSGATSYTVQSTFDMNPWCFSVAGGKVTASAKGKTSSPKYVGPPFC